MTFYALVDHESLSNTVQPVLYVVRSCSVLQAWVRTIKQCVRELQPNIFLPWQKWWSGPTFFPSLRLQREKSKNQILSHQISIFPPSHVFFLFHNHPRQNVSNPIPTLHFFFFSISYPTTTSHQLSDRVSLGVGDIQNDEHQYLTNIRNLVSLNHPWRQSNPITSFSLVWSYIPTLNDSWSRWIGVEVLERETRGKNNCAEGRCCDLLTADHFFTLLLDSRR